MRDPYWDIIKGFGIIFVVTAHSSILEMEINWFHLSLFFFVSGFLLNAEKCLDYGKFFLHKLETLWKPFVLYNTFFILLNNFFISVNCMLTQQMAKEYAVLLNEEYPEMWTEGFTVTFSDWIGIYEIPRHIVSTVLTGSVNSMCGATWFMAPFFFNILLFAFLVKVSYKKATWMLPFLIILFFASGVAITENAPGMAMYADMAMFLLPITAAGFYLKKFCSEKNIHVSELTFTYKGIFLLSAAIIVFCVLEYNNVKIQLAGYGMGNWYTFLLAAFSGIFITMFLTKLVLYVDLLKKILGFIGKKSFHIMALHFVGFKFVTSVYVLLTGSAMYLMSVYLLMWIPQIVYVIAGVVIPLIFCKIYDELKRRFL